jgi:hypothetical protein
MAITYALRIFLVMGIYRKMMIQNLFSAIAFQTGTTCRALRQIMLRKNRKNKQKAKKKRGSMKANPL